MGEKVVSDSTLGELFDLIRQNTEAIHKVDKNVVALQIKIEEKDKVCQKHDDIEVIQNNRLASLELWRAGQSGVWVLAWKVAPLVVSCGAVYAALHKGG